MEFKVVPTENFADLRQSGGYYVDKTGFLELFLNASPSVALFTRPRRFGKTLFMSMLAEFFDITKASRELFADLAVSSNEKFCAQWMNQYPVLSLTLKDVRTKSHELALEDIHSLVRKFCNRHKYLLSSERVDDDDKSNMEQCLAETISESALGRSLFALTSALSSHYGRPVIVLIDEYDVPVAKAAEKGYYDEMIEFMRDFLSRPLKTNPCLKFAILTGALRITKESMFTGLNNLRCFDISAPPYADVFGFTQAEVDKMLADAGCEEKREIIREWYDGYHFGDRADMYCPWSITNYLHDLQIRPMEPQAYWTNTSGNELTKGFVDHVPANIQDDMAFLLAGNSIDVHLNETVNYTQLYNSTNNFWTLLYLTGYLTTSCDSANNISSLSSSSHEPSTLIIPNKEVQIAFENEIVSWFANIVPGEQQTAFMKNFWDGDAQGLEELLAARMLSSASVRDYQYGEHFYHALLLGIFLLVGYSVTSNQEAGIGFPDLVVVDKRKKRAAVIELKVAHTENELEQRVQAALEQIETRKYDAPLKSEGYAVFRWGMAFCKKACRMAVLPA